MAPENQGKRAFGVRPAWELQEHNSCTSFPLHHTPTLCCQRGVCPDRAGSFWGQTSSDLRDVIESPHSAKLESRRLLPLNKISLAAPVLAGWHRCLGYTAFWENPSWETLEGLRSRRYLLWPCFLYVSFVKTFSDAPTPAMVVSSALFYLFIYLFLGGHLACGISVPWLGAEPVPLAVEAWSPNCWIAREIPSPLPSPLRNSVPLLHH